MATLFATKQLVSEKREKSYILKEKISTEKLKVTEGKELAAIFNWCSEVWKNKVFNEINTRFRSKIYSKCILMLKNDPAAQDATQEVMIKIFKNLHKFQAWSKLSTWIYSITYNFCIDLIRKQKKRNNLNWEPIEWDIWEEEMDNIEEVEIKIKNMHLVLKELPINDKAVLMMKYHDEMTIKEIAEILDKTESAIKMQIKRAKHKSQRIRRELFSH